MKTFLVLLLLALITGIAEAQSATWCKLPSSITHAALPIGVWPFGQTVIVWDQTFTYYDSLRVSTDDGGTWTSRPITMNIGTRHCYADLVYFYSASVGFAVAGLGGSPFIFKTIDTGRTWTQAYSNTVTVNSEKPWTMQFVSPSVGFFSGGTNNLYKTTDGGTTFAKINPTSTVNGIDINLANPSAGSSFAFYDANHGYVVGTMIDYTVQPAKYYGAARTADGGSTWTFLEVPGRVSGTFVKEYTSVAFLPGDINTVWLGAYNSQLNGQGGRFTSTSGAWAGPPVTWSTPLLYGSLWAGSSTVQIDPMPNGYFWASTGDDSIFYANSVANTMAWGFGSNIKHLNMQASDSGWAIIGNFIWHYSNWCVTVSNDSLTAIPSILNFDTIIVGDSARLQLHISNLGTANATIDSIRLPCGNDFADRHPNWSSQLIPGGTLVDTVIFWGDATRKHDSVSCDLKIFYDGSKIITIRLVGFVDTLHPPPDTGHTVCDSIQVTPFLIAFGVRPFGDDSSLVVRIRNNALRPVSISGTQIAGNGTEFVWSGIHIPTIINPMSDTIITVTYKATSHNQADSGSLKLSFDYLPDPCYTILLHGRTIPWPDSVSISPSIVDYGTRCYGDEYTASIMIRNDYSFPITLFGDAIIGPSAAHYSSENILELPYVLPPNGSSTFEFTVKYRADDGTYAIDGDTLLLKLSGELTAYGEPGINTTHPVPLIGKTVECAGVGADLAADNEIVVSPNPFDFHTNITLRAKESGKRNVRVCDILGRTVFATSAIIEAGEMVKLPFDAAGLENGVYRVLIQSGGGMISCQFVKTN